MNGDEPLDGTQAELSDEYLEEAVFFVVNWHAATVNVRLYPPTSSMVTDTVQKAREHLETLFDEEDVFSVSVLENSLLVNDVRLEELTQQKAPIKSFVQWMNERGLTNLEFTRGVTPEEMSTVFEVLSTAAEKDHRQNLSEVLVERGVTNVTINQRVYVAISTGEDYEDGIRRASPLDALKDELLMRYLMGKVDLGSVEDKELVGVLSDPGKVGGLLSTFIREEGSEGGVLVRSQKAEEALNRLMDMVDQVEDESLRAVLSDQIGGIIAEMTPKEMTSMLTGEAPENLNIGRVRERVITMLADNQLLEMVDSLIDEYQEMKDESDELETEWQKEKLRNLNELLVEVREERGIEISDVIDQKLETAGIAEERDPETGRRVLSAYQLLGGPLEEEFVELAEGIDQTVSQQIQRLYAMEETELAAGMLEKLADNLKQDSPKIRRFAATLVKDTLEGLEREYQLVAAGALEATLIEDVEAEQDYAAYIPQVDAVAVLARAYMQEGMAGRATDILDLLKEQSREESGKGPELMKHAATVLEKLTGPEGMVDVQALLMEDDEEKRANTVRALAGLGPSALSPLVDMVKDRGQIDLRDRALEAIIEAGPVGIEALLAELKAENPWYIYRNVLNVVAELKLTEAVEEVGEMVNHPDERIRREAIRSLARIGSRDSVSVVIGAANDPSPAVRRTAVRVLGMFGDSSVAGFLLDIINAQGPRGREEDQAVVEAACLALGDLKDTAYVPQLVDLLGKGGLFKKARPDEIRAAACIALSTIGDESIVPVIEKATKDPSMMVRTSAEKALRKLTGGLTAPEPVALEEERPAEAAEAPVEAPAYRPAPHPEAAAAAPAVEAPPEPAAEAPPPPVPEPLEPHAEAPPPYEAPRVPSPPEWVDMPVQPSQVETGMEPGAETTPSPEAPELGPATIEGYAAQPPEPAPQAPPPAQAPQPSGEYLPPEIPPDDIYIDNLAGEEDTLYIPEEAEGEPAPELGPATIEGYAAQPPEPAPQAPPPAQAPQPSGEYLPPEIPPDDIYIDNLAGEEDTLYIPEEAEGEPAPELGPATIEGYAAQQEQPTRPQYGAGGPGQAVELPPEWRVPGEPAAQSEESAPDWPMLDYPGPEQAEQPPPQPGPAAEPPLPADADYGPGRTDQPSTIERMMGQPGSVPPGAPPEPPPIDGLPPEQPEQGPGGPVPPPGPPKEPPPGPPPGQAPPPSGWK